MARNKNNHGTTESGFTFLELAYKDDPVHHPSHYTDGKIEVWDFIVDKKLSYLMGTAVKYIARAGKKDPLKHVEDIQKAIAYLNREIERIEGEKTDV